MATFEELQAASERVKGGRTVPSVAEVLSSPVLVTQLAQEKRNRDERAARLEKFQADAEAARLEAERLQRKTENKFLKLGEFTYNLGRSILQAPQRAITSVALDPTAGILSLITGRDIKAEFKPEGKLQQFFLGKETIKGVQVMVEEAIRTGQQVGEAVGLDPATATGASFAGAPAIVAGTIGLDLLPIGGGKKAIEKKLADVAKKVAKSEDPGDIAKVLKTLFKGTDEAFETASQNFRFVDDPKRIQNILRSNLAEGGFKQGTPINPNAFFKDEQEALDRARKFVQGVNTDKLEPEVKAIVDDLVENVPEVLAPRRVISNSESIANAGKVGERPILKELLSAPEGQLTSEALNIRKQIGDAILSAKGDIDSAKTINTLLKTRGKVSSEAARALQSFQIPDEALSSIQKFADDLLVQAKRSGDPDFIKEAEDLVAETLKGGKAGPTAFGRIYEYWINSILSSPLTHKANIIGNMATTIMKPIERIFELPFDIAGSLITKRRTIKAGQIPHEVMGMFSGLTEGVRKGLRLGLTQEKALGKFAAISKIEERVKNIPGIAGKFIRIPTKLLEVEDVFFKLVNGTGELYGLAYREAKKLKLSGDDFYKKVADLIENPTKEMLEEVGEEQLYRTFQNDLGTWGKKFMQLRNVPRDGSVWSKAAAGVTRFVVPFVRTPVNITKFALERSPAGFFKLIGAKSQKEVTQILARATMGSSIAAAVAFWTMQGRITGSGPKNRNERDALFRQGWQPYSVLVGDKYYSYQRLEPSSMIVGFTADAVERAKESGDEIDENIAAQIVYSISQNLSDKTFFSGISGLFDTISDPERYAEIWISRQSAGFVPNVLSFFSRGMDRTIKNTKADSIPEAIWQKVQSKIPGLSEEVLPKKNAFGQDIKREGNLLTDLLLPQFSTIKQSRLENELKALDTQVTFPATSSRGVKFNQKEYDSLVLNTGSRIKKDLDRLISTPLYEKASQFSKQKLVNDIVNIHKNAVRDQVFMYAQMRQLGYLDVPQEKTGQLIQLMAFPGWGSLDDDQRLNAVNKVLYGR